MAHLERNRVVRGRIISVICLVLYLTIGILSHSVQFAYAQSSAEAETVSISGTKIWVDRDGNVLSNDAHPDSADLSLFANGEKVDTKKVTAEDNWNWKFSDLPKFDDNGKEIIYTVREASLNDYTSDMKIVVLNTYSPSKEIFVKKVWEDSDDRSGMRPESVTVRLLADEVLVDGKTLVLNKDNSWSGTFTGLPVMNASTNDEINYTVIEEDTANYSVDITGDQDQGFTITNTYVNPEFMLRRFAARPGRLQDQEEENTGLSESPVSENTLQDTGSADTGNNGSRETGENTIEENSGTGGDTNGVRPVIMERIPESFKGITELPGTGLTGPFPISANLKDAKPGYELLSMELEIPSLNVIADVVRVPFVEGNFPVEQLGMDAGLLEGTALPGDGITVLAAHNTLSNEEYGPFALIPALEKGERIFVRDENDSMMIFEVYSNAKIEATDVSGLFAVASEYSPSLTLLTCEDELITGGYASRRIVSARKIN